MIALLAQDPEDPASFLLGRRIPGRRADALQSIFSWGGEVGGCQKNWCDRALFFVRGIKGRFRRMLM